MTKELILGSTGFIGSLYSSKNPDLYTPDSSTINLNDKISILKFLDKYNDVKTLINFAAYTNTKSSQNQIGDLKAPAWTTNVIGTKNIAEACYEKGVFLIYISTDSVFFDKKGPSDESTEGSNSGFVDWYGHTKLKGEEEVKKSKVKNAIVRIAYPFGDPKNPRDYCRKLIESMKKGYPLFNDQLFTPTYLPQAIEAINKISLNQIEGIFHASCNNIATPYKIGLYLNNKLNLNLKVKEGSIREYQKVNGKQTFAQQGGLTTTKTSKQLGIEFFSWQEALDKYCEDYQRNLPNI